MSVRVVRAFFFDILYIFIYFERQVICVVGELAWWDHAWMSWDTNGNCVFSILFGRRFCRKYHSRWRNDAF